MNTMNDQDIAAVFAKYLGPDSSVLFVTDTKGNRSAVAFTGPAGPVAAAYRKAGYTVDDPAALRKAS